MEKESVKLSAVDEKILSMLQRQKMYGLEILDELNQKYKVGILPWGFGSLYPALNRLEKYGLISWEWGEMQEESGGVRRKYYWAK